MDTINSELPSSRVVLIVHVATTGTVANNTHGSKKEQKRTEEHDPCTRKIAI